MPHAGHPWIDLVTRKLAALTRFRTLRHLDLDVGAVGEVMAGHPEAAGRDLLDRTAAPVAVGIAVEAIDGLAALTRIRPATKAIHGDRQGFVRLGGDGA